MMLNKALKQSSPERAINKISIPFNFNKIKCKVKKDIWEGRYDWADGSYTKKEMNFYSGDYNLSIEWTVAGGFDVRIKQELYFQGDLIECPEILDIDNVKQI